FYDFSVIQKCQTIGRKTVFCEKSRNLADVKVEDLLKGVTMQEWDVFISYSSKDYAIIQNIINDFKLNHINYWIDREQIKPGDFIIPRITAGLENSRYILPCFSWNQSGSGWSRAEYESILYEIFSDKQSKRKVIPLVIDDINTLPRLMMNIKYTKYSDNNAYNELIEFLKNKKDYRTLL
ncbi:MAG: toll/interleukin-1 receptor domain-containing protein, partial [Spirochaetales bacterium]|nr:toll/interleukin-1 receptor domain-containing protein [Spirochaetales bacterium]